MKYEEEGERKERGTGGRGGREGRRGEEVPYSLRHVKKDRRFGQFRATQVNSCVGRECSRNRPVELTFIKLINCVFENVGKKDTKYFVPTKNGKILI
jgi:hypothetical protein